MPATAARTVQPRTKPPQLRKLRRARAALHDAAHLLHTPSPVSAPLGCRPEPVPATPVPETAAQRARALVRLKRRQHEDELWQRYLHSRTESARNALWVHYQPLVRYISERLKAKLPECIDICDLIGAGNIGLQDAISKFEPAVGVRFETYCVPRIRGAILDSIRALDWVPRLIRNKTHQFERVVRDLAAELHREPSEEEIGLRLCISPQEFRELRRELNVRSQISVESRAKSQTDDRDLMRLEMLESRREFEPTRELQREEIRAMALRGLSSKERVVVEQYYFQGRSMKQIRSDLRLSESRICQIHSQVLEVLRKKFRVYKDSCYL